MTQGNGGELQWFALRTLPKREDMVKKLLIWRGVKAFIKTEKRARRKTKKDVKREARIFCAAPGYVFVGIDPRSDDAETDNPWALVHNCHLIRSVVSLNGLPAQLDPAKLADFLGFDDFDIPDYFMYFRTKGESFAIGDHVRIDSPSFEGMTLPVMDIQNGEAIFSLVMFQSQATELRIPLEQVFKAA
jgi:transcription antitermination factor NusG